MQKRRSRNTRERSPAPEGDDRREPDAINAMVAGSGEDELPIPLLSSVGIRITRERGIDGNDGIDERMSGGSGADIDGPREAGVEASRLTACVLRQEYTFRVLFFHPSTPLIIRVLHCGSFELGSGAANAIPE